MRITTLSEKMKAWRKHLQREGFIKPNRKRAVPYTAPELPQLHFKMDYTEELDLYGSVLQAAKEAREFHKLAAVPRLMGERDWIVTMPFDDWARLIKDAGYAVLRHCYYCNSQRLIKNGKTEKFAQRYLCKDCGRWME